MTMTRKIAIYLAISAGIIATIGGKLDAATPTIVGGSDANWLIKNSDDKKTFSLACRQIGGEWKWVASNYGGTPSAWAAVNSQLHVLTDGGKGYMIFSPNGNPPTIGLNPSDPRWTSNAKILAMFPANGFLTTPVSAAASSPSSAPVSASVLAIVADNAPMVSSKPAAPQEVNLFANVVGQWKWIANLNQLEPKSTEQIQAAAVGDKIYVLPTALSPANRQLFCVKDGKVTKQSVKSPTTVLSIDGQLILPELRPYTEQHDSAPVATATQPVPTCWFAELSFLNEATGEFHTIAIRKDGKSMQFPADANVLPKFVQAGKQVGIFWPENDKMNFAISTLTGEIVSQKEIPSEQSSSGTQIDQKTLQILEFIIMAILVATVFILRPKRRPEGNIVRLPIGIAPAGLIKRLIAGIIDLFPWNFLAFVFFPFDLQAALSIYDTSMPTTDVPANLLYCSIMTLATYMIYCTAMEKKFGATFGKMLFGLKVVGISGEPITLKAAILRNLIKVIELTWMLLIVFVLFTRTRQRIADIISCTILVERRREEQVEDMDDDLT